MYGGFVLILILRLFLHITCATFDGMEMPDSACNSTIRRNVRVALWNVIIEHFVPRASEFLISVHAKHIEGWLLMQDLLSCTLPYLNKSKIQIETYDAVRLPSHSRQFNLLLIDGVQALNELDPAALTRDFDFPEHYLVLLIDTETSLVPDLLISSILSYFYRNYLINVSLLFERKPDYVEVYTYFPFMENSPCKKNNVKIVNYYNGSWHHPLATHIFPKKLLNFQNCSLIIAVWDTPPYLSYYPEKSGYEQLGSFEGDMLVELAKKLNFTMNLVEPENDEQRGQRLPDGNLTGAMRMLHDHMADVSLGCFRYTVERCEVLTGAWPYYQTWQIFGVQLTGQTYSSLEIFGFPFDIATWLCLLVSFQLILFLAYTIHGRCDYSPLARIIIGYPRPQSPLTNAYSLFLGVSIQETPRTNFTRFVFCLWIIYGYLMRSAYQSCLYKLLQTDLYRTPPQTIFELIAQGYSLVMTKATYNTVVSAPLIRQGRIPIIFNNETYEWKSYEMMERLGGKLAAVSPKDYLTYYITSTHKRGEFYILPDRFFAQHITIYFPKHSFLINRFNDLLLQLRSQGMIDVWARRYLDMSYYELIDTDSNDALDMEDLWGVFFAYFVLLGFTVVVFLVEVIWYQVTLRMLHDHMADLSLGSFRYDVERCKVLTGAWPYYQTWQILGVQLTGQTYSSLEIFGFPFDLATWLCLLVSFQLILLLAYTIHGRCDYSPLARIIIGYPRPQSPLTNAYSLFLGVSIQETPRTNFARFVLCLWIIYGYLMRSAYQSFLYKLLQTELYRTPPQTIFDLIAQGYSLVMTKATYNTVVSAPLIRQGRIPIIFNNETYEWKSYQMLEHLGGKLAGVSPKDYLTYYIMSTRKRGEFHILRGRFFAQYITIYFPKHSFLINRFNDLLLQLRSQGMIDVWAGRYLDMSYYELIDTDVTDPLDMDDLWGVFFSYFVLLGFTVVVFLLEVIWYQVTLWMVGWIQ